MKGKKILLVSPFSENFTNPVSFSCYLLFQLPQSDYH